MRVSDTEWGALQQALAIDHPVSGRRPTLPEWIRDLVVAHASEVLRVEVTRAALRPSPGGAPNWKRWRPRPGCPPGRAAATHPAPLNRHPPMTWAKALLPSTKPGRFRQREEAPRGSLNTPIEHRPQPPQEGASEHQSEPVPP